MVLQQDSNHQPFCMDPQTECPLSKTITQHNPNAAGSLCHPHTSELHSPATYPFNSSTSYFIAVYQYLNVIRKPYTNPSNVFPSHVILSVPWSACWLPSAGDWREHCWASPVGCQCCPLWHSSERESHRTTGPAESREKQQSETQIYLYTSITYTRTSNYYSATKQNVLYCTSICCSVQHCLKG